MDSERVITLQIPLEQLDRSDYAVLSWMIENQKNGYKPLTWRVEGGFAHFFMEKENEIEINRE